VTKRIFIRAGIVRHASQLVKDIEFADCILIGSEIAAVREYAKQNRVSIAIACGHLVRLALESLGQVDRTADFESFDDRKDAA